MSLTLGSADLEGSPDLDPKLGVEHDVDGEGTVGLVVPELGGGDVPLEQLLATERRGELGGRLGGLVEGVERGIAKRWSR
jgi:hypothetical protein